MRPLDLETSLCLLPCVGLFGCAVVGDAPAVSAVPEQRASGLDGWIEQESSLEPLSLAEAAQRSATLELAQGNYAAAEAAVSFALEHESALAELLLTRSEAALALGEFERAEAALLEYADRSVIAQRDQPAFDRSVDNRLLDIRERAHDVGSASCETELERARQPLQRHASALSVFNELRAHMSSTQGLEIPLDEEEAMDALCVDDCDQQVYFVRLQGEQDAIVGVVVRSEDALFLLPELVHPQTHSCEDETQLAYEIEGDRLRVRAYSDTLGEPEEAEDIPVEDWRLGIEAELGAIREKVEAAGRTPMNYYAGSGYGSSGYGSSGYYSSGCSGGYDYDYDYYDGYGYCEVVHRVQRDTFIDLRRGEVILDIVRTGSAEAGLGRVAPEGGTVEISACGVEERLPLSWTAA